MGFDWKKATEVFYSLTDTQLVWLERMASAEKKIREVEHNRMNRQARGRENVRR